MISTLAIKKFDYFFPCTWTATKLPSIISLKSISVSLSSSSVPDISLSSVSLSWAFLFFLKMLLLTFGFLSTVFLFLLFVGTAMAFLWGVHVTGFLRTNFLRRFNFENFAFGKAVLKEKYIESKRFVLTKRMGLNTLLHLFFPVCTYFN